MGTISDKLDYLEETKKLLREELTRLGATVTDEDTFRSYVEKIEDANGMQYISKAVLHNRIESIEAEVVQDIIGEHSIGYSSSYFPNVSYPEIESDDYITVTLPFTGRNVGASSNSIITGGYMNYQRVKAPDNYRIRVYHNMISPATLILPDRVLMYQYTLGNGSNSHSTDSNSFTRGLGFGRSVADSTSNWMMRTLNTVKRVVKFPSGFKLDSGSTLYLSKIYITKDCMKEMVQNLYDYIGNGETEEVTRTISVGSTNYNLLTSDERQTALDKGWKITS